MDPVLENVVALVKDQPSGVPLRKLPEVYSSVYRHNLSLSAVGVSSVAGLVACLRSELVVVKKVVYHKDHYVKGKETPAAAAAAAAASADAKPKKKTKKEKVVKRLVSLLEQLPDGVPLNHLSSIYQQNYQQTLTLSKLDFHSMADLVNSVEELFVKNKRVFHKIYQPEGLSSTTSTDHSRSSTPDQSRPSSAAGCRPLTQTGSGLLGTPLRMSAPCTEGLSHGTRGAASSKNLHLSASEPTVRPRTAESATPSAAEPQEQDLPLNFLSGTDFPELMSKLKLKPKPKQKDLDHAPVFMDAYHAQLREVHGANMRALETVEEEQHPLTGGRRRKLDQEMVNSLMEDVRREIAAEGELVTEMKVIARTCRLLQVSSLEALGFKRWSFQALKDLQYITREIQIFIKTTEAVTTLCTLYELGQSLAALKDRRRFEELNLGPLCKIPDIHRMFKIHSDTKDDDVHQIHTVDILKHLRVFRDNKPKGAKVDLTEFLQYLTDQYSCESPYELGIRINSIPLSVSTLSKVRIAELNLMTSAKEVILKELEEEVLERLRKTKRSVMEALQGVVGGAVGGAYSCSSCSAGNMELRRRYSSITAAELVLEVFTNAEGVFTSRMTKHVQNFLMHVQGDRLATALFQLAICGGSLAVPPDLVPKDHTPKTTKDQAKTESDRTVPKDLPSAAKLKEFVKTSLSSCNSAMTLDHVSSVERKLIKHFQVSDFLSLQQGSFLDFLVKNIQLLQDAVGSMLFLSRGGLDHVGNGLRPNKQDVFEFIKQCGDLPSTNPDDLSHVEAALRSHYRVQDTRDLGFGTLPTLVSLVQRLSGLTGGAPSQVFYQTALFAQHAKSSPQGGNESVGRLGETTMAQALDSLLCCPLLEDLSEWSQWELIFQPAHGSIKEFIQRNAGNSGLAALEVSPGQLLRITSHTGDGHFHRAVRQLDAVDTAGHLVSMVVSDGPDHLSTALLANYTQNALEAAVAADASHATDFCQTEDQEESSYRRVADFILTCLTRIPLRICQTLSQQVFLVPLSRAVGQVKSRQVLLTAARSDPRHLNRLHRLGFLLGVTEWVKDYQRKLSPQQRQDHSVCNSARVDQVKSNLLSSASSSLSALNTSEDEFLEENVLETQLQRTHTDDGDGDEEEEELFELAPVVNGDFSSLTNEGGGENEKESDMSDSEEEELDDVTDSSQSESGVSPQRAIVEDIRKSEFGVGEELEAKGQKLMQKNQDRLGRSLERLSAELYSKDTHFVLELIQNADDNSYPLAVVPSLVFVVDKDCVTVLNNETGFQEKHIRAICDVGCSTKGRHQLGYIGQKGIGFKSVFKVTDCPEIHSNGFHLRFDRSSGLSLGYILPHWVEEERPVQAAISDLSVDSWTTQICLPLRPESHQTRNLFHDVHPSLLLFLHRLRSITICNQSEKRQVTMTRRDLSHDVVEVEHTEGGVERWLLVKTILQPRQLKEDVEFTELAMAFQLSGDDTGSDIISQPQKQPVFAYLPLRSFGFRFIVQGDFDIPSSREDVDRDSSWNQWLRSELPPLFLQAMDVFTEHPEFQGLRGLCHFLQFIPLPDEVLDFFKPVAGNIIKLLKGKAFLPTLGPDDSVVYRTPSQVAVCQDAVIRQVIGGPELERHLSLSYLHPGLSPPPPTSLLTQLGVRYLRGSDVTTVTTAMAKDLSKVEGLHSGAALRQLAQLLVCNFRALEYGYGESDLILQRLKELPIIPLADGRTVALSTEEVFFPMEETKKKKSDKVQTGPLSALYQDLSVVQPALLSCLDPLEGQQVRELLRRLGVHELEPQELLEQHIYPTIRSGRWKSKSQAVVISFLVFIKQHSTSGQDYADLAVPVLTSSGLLCPAMDRVYFSEEYGNINLTKKLPGYEWTLLSPCYVQTDWDAAGWRELFQRLGVRDGFIIRKERKTLTAAELEASPWSSESRRWGLKDGEGCVLDDYPCEEFESLATAQLPGTLLLQQRAALLKLLSSNWDTGHHYAQYLTAQVIDSEGRPVRKTGSSFSHLLSSLEWVPAQRPAEEGPEDRTYLRPNAVFLSSPEVCGLLGTHVYFLDLESSDFTRALGMRQSISVDVLIGYLKEWCVGAEPGEEEEQRAEQQAGGTAFTTTVQHIHTVYTYLHTNCPQSSLKELFQHTPAVFIGNQRRANGWCTGSFHHLKEVCWSDPTLMFQRYRPLLHCPDSPVQEPRLLAPFYGSLDGMKDFFTRLLSVDSSPNMNQYVALLQLVCLSAPVPTADVLQDVSLLYARLAQKCKVQLSVDPESSAQLNLNPGYCSTLKGMVSGQRVFPTKSSWVTLAHRPMIPDHRELEKIFKPHPQVCLLNLPPPTEKNMSAKSKNFGDRSGVPYFNCRDRDLFLDICGVRPLSQCVRTESQSESLRPCIPMQALVREVVPYVQRFLYHHEELSQVYAQLLDDDIAQRVKRLQFGQVGKLYIRYELDLPDSELPLVEMENVICLLKDRKELYIQKDHLNAKLDICRELAKLFCSEVGHRKELDRFLSAVTTSLSDPAALKRLLHREDVRELPQEAEQWEVPEPPRPEVPLDRVLPRISSSSLEALAGAPPHPPPRQDGEEQLLACWPPRAPMHCSGGSPAGQSDGSAVDTVMKMWPPPAPPKDQGSQREGAPQREGIQRDGGHVVPQSPSSSEGNQTLRTPTTTSCRPPEHPGLQRSVSQSGPAPPPPSSTTPPAPAPSPPVSEQSESSSSVTAEEGEVLSDPGAAQSPDLSAADSERKHQQQQHHHPATNSLGVPEAVVLPSSFQGPLNLDFPLWTRVQPPEETLEDLRLDCPRPSTVVLSDEQRDMTAIGEWGEQLVHSFLSHWRDSGAPGRPSSVVWCNQQAESGQPFDFRLGFEEGGSESWTYVEVKSTLRKERTFVHLSVNEMDFALRERERYHVYRVYSAGDASAVRLCRIQNLAKHLQTKDLELFLFL